MNENPGNSAPNSPSGPHRPARRSLTPWVLALPLLLGAGLLWRATRDPEQPIDPDAGNRASNQISQQPAPLPTPDATPIKTPTAVLNYTLFVPAEDEKLHRRIVKGTTTDKDAASQALRLLMKQAPDFFPSGTRLTAPVRLRNSVAEVSFNKDFVRSNLWSSELLTNLTIAAVVNTASENVQLPSKGAARPSVQLLVDGKRFETLGQMDVKDAFPPDMSLVAKS